MLVGWYQLMPVPVPQAFRVLEISKDHLHQCGLSRAPSAPTPHYLLPHSHMPHSVVGVFQQHAFWAGEAEVVGAQLALVKLPSGISMSWLNAEKAETHIRPNGI